MKKKHAEEEHQVWQRVLAQPGEPPRNDLRQLQQEIMELVGIYRQLLASAAPGHREGLKALLEGEQANVACLKGLAVLSGESREVLKVWNPAKGSRQKLLETCYHKTRRCMIDCMALSPEPEYGVVFRQMADREALHCSRIAQLLGSL